MNEIQAQQIAVLLRGEIWNSGGGIWLVLFERADGKIAVLSDEVMKLYDSRDAFDGDQAIVAIVLH